VKNVIINNTEEPNRDKKLLLRKHELTKLEKELTKGLTIVPFSFFTNDRGSIKCTIVLGRRNKSYEKKQKLKEKDLEREKKLED
jgi:SsrA-binding protein